MKDELSQREVEGGAYRSIETTVIGDMDKEITGNKIYRWLYSLIEWIKNKTKVVDKLFLQ